MIYYYGWIAVIVIIILFILIIIDADNKSEKKKKEMEKQSRERQEELERVNEQKRKRKEELDRLYGICVKEIESSDPDSALKHPIYVYEKSKVIILNDEPIKFHVISGVSVYDEKTIKKGDIIVTTNTNTGSMVGRAIVGEMLAGDAGMVLGGATAKTNTVIKQEDEKIVHDYVVLVELNDLARPVIRINFGDEEKYVNELISVLNIIIRRNNGV